MGKIKAVMLGRADRSTELKREVNEFRRRLGEPLRYPSQAADATRPPGARRVRLTIA